MDAFEIGSCFKSYTELMEKLSEYCESTNTKFTTKDSRLITDEFATAKESFVYSELKLICIYGRSSKYRYKEQARKRKMRTIKIPKTECPAYFRIKLINSGVALQIVAMNTKHNHVCEKIEEPIKEQKRKKDKIKREIKSEDEDNDDPADDLESSVYIEVYIDPDEDIGPEKKVKFSGKGVFVPVFNAFSNDSSVNVEPISEYAEYLSSFGVNGVVVNSCTGEGTSMNISERKLVTEKWIEITKPLKMQVMVQIGGCALPDVVELAKHAESLNAESILCMPELYFRPTSNEALADYLKIVSESAPKTPLFYSHNPEMSGINLNMVDFLNTYGLVIPTFCGIEYVPNDLSEAESILEASHEKYKIFYGTESQLSSAVYSGFDSGIIPAANLFPQQVSSILKSTKNTKTGEVRRLQKELNVNCTAIYDFGFWVSSMKACMNLMAPFSVGICRAPLKNLSDEDVTSMKLKLNIT
uniref:N-acetylneuraminate lyase n=2 Tax=Diabrotica virgifera virgifera TaxID=50390 RepID=A0A6P7GP48_DIAVI